MKAEKCKALKRAISELKENKRRATSARNKKDAIFTQPTFLDDFLKLED